MSIIKQFYASKTSESESGNSSSRLGFWSAIIGTVMGAIYLAVILGTIITGQFNFPPPESIQVFASIISLLFCIVLVVIMACLHTIMPAGKRGLSQISLGFVLLFAISVSINRFVHLGVVQQSVLSGNTVGIEWFLPYGGHSVMFALEILGWGWFLGIASLFAAFLFSKGKLEHWLRWLFTAYGILGLLSALGQLLNSPLIMVGFIAWGVVLYIITALLAVYFKRTKTISS